MRIHKAGTRPLFITALLMLVLSAAIVFAALNFEFPQALALLIFPVAFQIWAFTFFRYPDRSGFEHEPGKLYSAADGKVVLIEKLPATENEAERIQVSVFMSIYNVHLNYVPIDGKIIHSTHIPGKHLMAIKPKASMLNEQIETQIKTEAGQIITIRQIAGAAAKRVLSFVKAGQEVKAGDELGFIRFGSRVDHIFPADAKIMTSVGEKVIASSSVIAVISEPSE
ncbi:MAG: phosphatidylserine decarboxylase family protein [Marinilabiliales bacterium]|nr:MAG: phosphatidylserine decarboxylase family protein [Marinilabiliales bacterium]